MSAFEDDDVDRAAILRRRAMFVASALASVTSVHLARADEPPSSASAGASDDAPCTPPPEPTPDDLATAKALFDEGRELSNQGRPREAAEMLERAYRRAPRPKAALAAATMWIEAHDVDRGHRLVADHLRCVGSDADLAAEKTRIEETTGIVELRVSGPGAGLRLAVTIDGADVEVARLTGGMRLEAGRHDLRWNNDAEGRLIALEVRAGSRNLVEIHTEQAVPMPCLSPWPCLEPPPPPGRRRARVDAVPSVGLQVAPRFPFVGPTARVAVGVRLGDEDDVMDVVLDPGGALLVGDDDVAELDLTLLLRGWATPKLWIAGGGMFGLTLLTEARDASVSPLAGPVFDIGVAAGPARIGLRVPVWFTEADQEARFLDVAPIMSIGFSMDDLLDDADEPRMATTLPRDDVSLR